MLLSLDTLSDSRLDAYARLTEAQLRNRLEPEKGIFIAESPKVITRAFKAGYKVQSFLVAQSWLSRMETFFENLDQTVPVFALPDEQISQLTGFNLTRGVLAAFSRPQLASPESIVKHARRIAVFDGIVDHTNVGAMFRSAAALGVDAVLLSPSCCDPLYRRAARVSMGAVFQIPWTRIGENVTDWKQNGVHLLHDLGFVTLAFALNDEACALDDPFLSHIPQMALLFGTEGNGLDQQIISDCDYCVKIPMSNGVDSLNVAAASALAFWQFCRPA